MNSKNLLRLTVVFYSILFLFTSFTILYEFVIPHGGFYVTDPVITTTTTETSTNTTESNNTDSTISTAGSVLTYSGEVPQVLQEGELIGSYSSDYALISVYKIRAYSSNVYVADVVVSDAYQILAGLAYNNFGGTNIVQTVSEMAEDHDAIFAINSDYATHYDTGFVIRNGMVLRSSLSYRSDVVLYEDGSVSTFKETSSSNVDDILNDGAWQLWSFGPVLISDGVSVADVNDGIDRDSVNNPRTAFGYISNNHFLFVCVDGRSTISAGVDVEELASIMLSLGATEAYNFDGGGSSTMYFNGSVINTPSQGEEREVSDCVYIKRA